MPSQSLFAIRLALIVYRKAIGTQERTPMRLRLCIGVVGLPENGYSVHRAKHREFRMVIVLSLRWVCHE
jgi:hypothetical protein